MLRPLCFLTLCTTPLALIPQVMSSEDASGMHEFDEDFGVVHVYNAPHSPTAASPHSKGNCTTDTAIIDKLLNGTGYNKFRIPDERGVDVAIEFWLQAITSINEITNDFEMDIYINEMWLDPMLNFEHLHPCKHNLSLM